MAASQQVDGLGKAGDRTARRESGRIDQAQQAVRKFGFLPEDCFDGCRVRIFGNQGQHFEQLDPGHVGPFAGVVAGQQELGCRQCAGIALAPGVVGVAVYVGDNDDGSAGQSEQGERRQCARVARAQQQVIPGAGHRQFLAGCDSEAQRIAPLAQVFFVFPGGGECCGCENLDQVADPALAANAGLGRQQPGLAVVELGNGRVQAKPGECFFFRRGIRCCFHQITGPGVVRAQQGVKEQQVINRHVLLSSSCFRRW